jgi:catechol 2,3-dioxygenase-like lactoylglutathione lyase family enzyme
MQRILETALYVEDLERAARFYQELFGFEVLLDTRPRLVALGVGGTSVLLLSQRGQTDAPMALPGGTVPAHGASGVQHLAFAVTAAELPDWEERLARAGVPVESRVRWQGGGASVYFRDPDNHSLELVTPGLWRIY